MINKGMYLSIDDLKKMPISTLFDYGFIKDKNLGLLNESIFKKSEKRHSPEVLPQFSAATTLINGVAGSGKTYLLQDALSQGCLGKKVLYIGREYADKQCSNFQVFQVRYMHDPSDVIFQDDRILLVNKANSFFGTSEAIQLQEHVKKACLQGYTIVFDEIDGRSTEYYQVIIDAILYLNEHQMFYKEKSQESRIIVTSQRIQPELKENSFLFEEIIMMRSNPSDITLALLNISDNEHYVMETGDYYLLTQISKDALYDALCQKIIVPSFGQEEKLKKETKYWKFLSWFLIASFIIFQLGFAKLLDQSKELCNLYSESDQMHKKLFEFSLGILSDVSATTPLDENTMQKIDLLLKSTTKQ